MTAFSYSEDGYTPDEFEREYNLIKEIVTKHVSGNEKCTIILGGQPGSGKSSYYQNNKNLDSFAKINGDTFRVFHPCFEKIMKADAENMAERTQVFVNAVTERLIDELGTEGYNMIIEGTLRDSNVPIRTCIELSEKGYHPELIVVACDAETSWLATIERAKYMIENKEPIRLVPIDIFNYTVNRISDNLKTIIKAGCFSSISIINREGKSLYPCENGRAPEEVLLNALGLDNWNTKYEDYRKSFIQMKIGMLQAQLSEQGVTR